MTEDQLISTPERCLNHGGGVSVQPIRASLMTFAHATSFQNFGISRGIVPSHACPRPYLRMMTFRRLPLV